MTSIEQFVEALQKLGYDSFDTARDALNKGDKHKPKSVWGKLSITLYGKNKATKRDSLSSKWRLNRGNFQHLVKQMMSTRKSIIPIDVSQLAVEHISTQLISAISYPDTVELSKMSLNEFDFSLPSLQRDVTNNSLLGLLASGCDDCQLYGLMSKIASSPPHTGRTDSHFWSFINCNNSLWLDAIIFFNLECPLVSGEFMLVDDKLHDQSKKFSCCLMESMQWIRLIRRNCNLVEAWILVENISCRILELFGNSYLAITVQQLDLFTSFILSCRESSDTLSSFHESLSLKLHNTSSSSDQQVPVPEIDITSNIPESKLLVPSVDDCTLGNEVIVKQSVFREEICGEFLLSGMEWKSITQINGDSVVFSKDWTNLFSSKIEGNFLSSLSPGTRGMLVAILLRFYNKQI